VFEFYAFFFQIKVCFVLFSLILPLEVVLDVAWVRLAERLAWLECEFDFSGSNIFIKLLFLFETVHLLQLRWWLVWIIKQSVELGLLGDDWSTFFFQALNSIVTLLLGSRVLLFCAELDGLLDAGLHVFKLLLDKFNSFDDA